MIFKYSLNFLIFTGLLLSFESFAMHGNSGSNEEAIEKARKEIETWEKPLRQASCVRCHKRHFKCYDGRPCANCRNKNVECIVRKQGKRGRPSLQNQKKQLTNKSTSGAVNQDSWLDDQEKRLYKILQELDQNRNKKGIENMQDELIALIADMNKTRPVERRLYIPWDLDEMPQVKYPYYCWDTLTINNGLQVFVPISYEMGDGIRVCYPEENWLPNRNQ